MRDKRRPDFRSHAFGMDIEAGFELPGFAPRPDGTGQRRIRLDLVAPDDWGEAWAGAELQRVAEVAGPDGEPAVSIDAVGGLGFEHCAEGFGRARITSDGRYVLVSPVAAPPWQWQRYLTGQVLPFAAVLQGLEVFHASSVVVDGAAVCVVSQSGVGKTSLALNLAMMGASFLGDDVALVEPADERLIVHPSVGLANVRHGGDDLARRLEEKGLGRPLGRTEHETRVAVPLHESPAPLGKMFFLRRVATGSEAVVEPLAAADPRLLLAATFNYVVQDAGRLARQLDVCSRIAREARLFAIECPPAVNARALAEQILEVSRQHTPA